MRTFRKRIDKYFRKVFAEEIIPVIVTYSALPEVLNLVENEGFKVYFPYEL